MLRSEMYKSAGGEERGDLVQTVLVALKVGQVGDPVQLDEPRASNPLRELLVDLLYVGSAAA